MEAFIPGAYGRARRVFMHGQVFVPDKTCISYINVGHAFIPGAHGRAKREFKPVG